MSTATDDERRVEEAGTDEVAALASMITAPSRPHRDDSEDGDDLDEQLSSARADDDEPVVVLPRQRDEFTCPACYLVMHVSRRVGEVCGDCS